MTSRASSLANLLAEVKRKYMPGDDMKPPRQYIETWYRQRRYRRCPFFSVI